MRVELYGLCFETPAVIFHLWSPWRCSSLEHRLFDAIKTIPGTQFETMPDELRVHLDSVANWKQAVQNLARVLKGWQEEATEAGTERRSWRWLLESDVDSNGYDMHGEKAAFWAYVRLSLERGGPSETEKAEDLDMSGFGICIAGQS